MRPALAITGRGLFRTGVKGRRTVEVGDRRRFLQTMGKVSERRAHPDEQQCHRLQRSVQQLSLRPAQRTAQLHSRFEGSATCALAGHLRTALQHCTGTPRERRHDWMSPRLQRLCHHDAESGNHSQGMNVEQLPCVIASGCHWSWRPRQTACTLPIRLMLAHATAGRRVEGGGRLRK